MDEQRSLTRNLHDVPANGERVLFTTGPHWVTAVLLFAFPTVLGLGRALIQRAFGVPGTAIWTSVLLFAGIGAAMAAVRVAMILYARYTVTEDRIVFQGILTGLDAKEIAISEIEDVSLIQDSLGAVLGYGHICLLQTTGDAYYVDWISRPAEFREHILGLIEMVSKAA